MFENYYVRSVTIDRIRGSWIAPAIEQYVDRYHWNISDYAIRSTVYARRTLLAGFTTIRNLGDAQNELQANFRTTHTLTQHIVT